MLCQSLPSPVSKTFSPLFCVVSHRGSFPGNVAQYLRGHCPDLNTAYTYDKVVTFVAIECNATEKKYRVTVRRTLTVDYVVETTSDSPENAEISALEEFADMSCSQVDDLPQDTIQDECDPISVEVVN